MDPRAARNQLFRSIILLLGAAMVAISFAARPHHARAQESREGAPPGGGEEQETSLPSETPEAQEALAKFKGPIERASIGVHISDLRNVEMREGKFEATLYYWIRHARKRSPEEAKELEELAFTNGQIEKVEEQDRRDIGDETYVAYKAEGEFNFHPDLHNYPLDTQALPIRIEQASLGGAHLRFSPDTRSYVRSGQKAGFWGLDKKIWLPEYTIDSVEQREMAVSYGTDFGNPVLAQTKPAHPTFVVTVFATRRFEPYLYKILLPLLCILGTAYLVFWLPPTDIKVACVLAIESLLSCFEFNVAIMEELPEVPYVMLTQKFFLWTFGILFTNLIQSVILYLLVKNGHDLAARRWSRTTRIVCPILFAACFGGLCLIARYR